MYKSVSSVEARNDYSLSVKFSNNQVKRVDFTPYLDFGVFKQLRNLDKFKKAHISFDTVEWEDGIDIDPEFLYEKGVTVP